MLKIKPLKTKGFTLLEVVLAISITSITLISLGLLFGKCSGFLSEIKERAIATQAAKEEMESIRNMGFDEILNLNSAFSATGFSELNNPAGSVIVDNPLGSDGIRRVTVTVTWSSTQGRTLDRRLVTLVTRNGINRK